MSDTLRVMLKRVRLDLSQQGHFERVYRLAAKNAVPPSRASSLRVAFRSESNETTVEPFLGTASLEALIGIKKKRADAMALLSTLVATAFLFADDVEVLFGAEGTTPSKAKIALALKALGKLSKRDKGHYRIVPQVEWFHFVNIEAKLFEPMKRPDGRCDTHYSREFWVRAVDRQIASSAVECWVADDGATVMSFGEIESAGVPAVTRGNSWLGDRKYHSGTLT